MDEKRFGVNILNDVLPIHQVSLYVQDNERNNQQLQFSASIPQTRRKEELGDR